MAKLMDDPKVVALLEKAEKKGCRHGKACRRRAREGSGQDRRARCRQEP